MAKEIEKKLLKELSRFKEINHNTENLNEQVVSNVGNLGMGSHIERLAKRFNMDEQEEVEVEDEAEIALDPDAEAEEFPAEGEEGDVGMEEGGEEMPGEDEEMIDTEIDSEVEGDTQELDVTDLVTKQDEVNTELSDQKDILSKNTQSLDDLMNKLSDLETHLTSMDDMVEKISNLENKIEEYRPRTPEEKIGLRKHDSGPYNKTLSDFFTDKEEVFDKTGKKQYILTKDDVEDYSKDDIAKSFQEPDEEE
tara:strand:- start:197 stop:949 length:753 start_codon:yes stop_codon:yes gene_type:complete